MTASNLLSIVSLLIIHAMVGPVEPAVCCAVANTGGYYATVEPETGAGQASNANQEGARSPYLVRNGEVTLRPGSSAMSMTSLSSTEELRLLQKSLAAAKDKATIADGSVPTVVDRADYYEVVIANPAPTSGGVDEVRVTVNKKDQSVVRVTLMHSDENARRIARFQDLAEKLVTSEYVFSKGALTKRPGGTPHSISALNDSQAREVIQKGLDAAKAKLTIPEGSGVTITDGDIYYEVVIGNPPAPGVLGADYTAKVLVDKKSLAVVHVLAGG